MSGVRPAAALVLVVAAVAGGGVAAQASRGTPAEPVAQGAAQRTAAAAAVASLSCPAPEANGRVSSVVTAVAPAQEVTAARGQLYLRPLTGRGRLPGDSLPQGGVAELVTERGQVLHVDVQPKTGPVSARATGALAPGLAAGQYSRAERGLQQGIATTSCSAASTESWLVGAGAGVGRTATLFLSNPGSAPALVDVEAWGPEGPLESRALTSLEVGPATQRVLRLDAEVPAEAYAVRVVARQGRVAAALRDVQADGLQPLGWDWVAPAAAPARRLVVPGVLAGSGTRTLRLVAPGTSGAVVSVAVVGPEGEQRPAELDSVPVEAGTVVDLDVSGTGDRAPRALVITSDVPVAAGLLVRQGAAAEEGTDPGELAHTAASAALAAGERAVVPYVATGVGRFAEVALTALEGSGRVRLVPLERPGRPAGDPVEVTVPAGTTRLVPLETGVGVNAHAVLVEVLEGSAPVWGAASLREAGERGPLISLLPLRAEAETVTLPVVQGDPSLLSQ